MATLTQVMPQALELPLTEKKELHRQLGQQIEIEEFINSIPPGATFEFWSPIASDEAVAVLQKLLDEKAPS